MAVGATAAGTAMSMPVVSVSAPVHEEHSEHSSADQQNPKKRPSVHFVTFLACSRSSLALAKSVARPFEGLMNTVCRFSESGGHSLERGIAARSLRPTLRAGMTRAVIIERSLGAAAVAAVIALALAAAPRAGTVKSEPSSASYVDVVGSGTLAWRQAVVRARPSEKASRVAVLKEFRPDFRPQYVLALSKLEDPKSGNPTWYRISVPGRPNGRTGWVRAASLRLRHVHKRLIIYRGARRFEFWDRDRLVRSGKVAVGKPGAETPLGLFYVTDKFDPRIDPAWAILGDYAFETSAYSKLSDWPGGGIVGVHGTPWPELLGQAVSHGCVRLHNDDINFLRWRVPVGMPVKIVR